MACRKGYSQYAEDLASEAVVMRLENPGHRQNLRHTYIDALRRIGMAPRNHKRLPQAKAKYAHPETVSQQDHFVRDFEKLIAPVKGEYRAMLVLSTMWGFTNREVAHCFGICESRVSQILSARHAKMKARAKPE